jgi:outer membrane lipoprotein SlyB
MKNPIKFAAVLLITGCAAHPDPIIDTKGVNMALYEQDLEECAAYSEQIHTEEGVIKGAAAGAAIGTATGAISGHPAEGAGYGAIAGGTESARLNEREKQQVVKNCLRYRGYKVLN